MKNLLSILMILALTGCLKTRAELKNDGSGNMQTDSSGTYVAGNMNQQQRAQIDSRFFEIDRDFRELYGKIEVIERKLVEGGAGTPVVTPAAPNALDASKEKLQSLEKRISTLEEALLALDKKISQLSQGRSADSAQVFEEKLKDARGPFGRGELLFAAGRYEEAIASYDQYRKNFPRGRRYPHATLKMGLCFQKLKMDNDAKAFYKEVIQRYPNTRVSVRAEENLKRL
jgi:TolA-binding protein